MRTGLWLLVPANALAALLDFWRKTGPDTGTLAPDFSDPRVVGRAGEEDDKVRGAMGDNLDEVTPSSERLTLLPAGLADLLPWLQQRHKDLYPEYVMGLGDYFAGFMDEECRKNGTTVSRVAEFRMKGAPWRPAQGGVSGR